MYIEKEASPYGIVLSASSTVISARGVAFVSEVLEHFILMSHTYSLVVSFHQDSLSNLTLRALLLSPASSVTVGAKVISTGTPVFLVLGDFTIGALLDPLGRYNHTTMRMNSPTTWIIESPAPSITSRESVSEPMQTGILAIDSTVPIGRGQRELVIGDRQTGKTSIGIDTIINQKYSKVLSLYVPIGQKATQILEVYLKLAQRDALSYSTLLNTSAASSPLLQYLSVYSGTAIAEYFMYIRELPVFIFYDDLSKHAQAYRELSLLLRRPPGREAYPGEIFFVHSRLLERSAKLSSSLGGGSITAFPVCETLAQDISAYIPTNVISITDGQIFLSQDLFNSGVKPAIDLGLSVTRVGSAAQWESMKLVAGRIKLELAQYTELQSFSQFVADLGKDTKKRLMQMKRLVEILKQPCGSPISLSQQVALLSIADNFPSPSLR